MKQKLIQNPKCIWISSPHNIGDFIAKIPLIILLKKSFPHIKIIVAARSYVKELVLLIHHVDHFVDYESFFNRNNESIVARLKDLKIDTLIHLLSRQREIGPNVLKFAELAGVKNRIGNCHRSKVSLWLKRVQGSMNYNLNQPRIIHGVHEFQWNLLVLKYFGLKSCYSMQEIAAMLQTTIQAKTSPFIDSEKFNLVIHPKSNGNAREWPKEHFLSLIEQLDKSRVNIILSGSLSESYDYLELKEHRDIKFAMGQCSLKEFAALVAQADGLIANSTGPIHLAALFKTKTIALFPKQREMSPAVWGPVNELATCLVSPSVCSFCENKLAEINPNLCQCMALVNPNEVLTAIKQKFLNESLV